MEALRGQRSTAGCWLYTLLLILTGSCREVTDRKETKEECRLIQEEQVGKDQNTKGLDYNEKDLSLFCRL